MIKKLLGAVIGGCSLFSAALAAPTTIDFDALGGGLINPADFAALGVEFSNATVVSTGFELSGANSIVSATGGFSWLKPDAIVVTFAPGVQLAGISGANVGFNGLRIEAFDAIIGGTLVAAQELFGTTEGGTAAPNPPGDVVTVSTAGPDIRRIEIFQVTNQFNDTIVLDNFFFERTTTGVSEAPLAGLMLLGLGFMGWMGRRRSVC